MSSDNDQETYVYPGLQVFSQTIEMMEKIVSAAPDPAIAAQSLIGRILTIFPPHQVADILSAIMRDYITWLAGEKKP